MLQPFFSASCHSPFLSPQELTALFQPFSVCEDYISPNYLKTELSKSILKAMRFVHDLSDDDMKDKEVRGGWGVDVGFNLLWGQCDCPLCW